jgi:DNA-directed RNA polymerase subunit beta'
MIDIVYRHCGQKATVIFCDKIMAARLQGSCRAGISFGKDDMLIPDAKATWWVKPAPWSANTSSSMWTA